ncbi:MAG: AMP-binding protein [Candidatus Acetothermia bacterium]|jgi:long-chain acyl-CoA synthetase|nr:AMP-binding protein [Candidatus Acetothermia bacterium]MDH7505099.1 AMP-binding protein [Candidatus Acetothermia bacterium]
MDERTIPQFFQETAARYPDRTAIKIPREKGYDEISYRELDLRSTRLAVALARRGIARGEKVVIFSPPRIEWAVALLGILKAGAVAVPLDAQLRAREVERIIAQAEARVVFVGPECLRASQGLGLELIGLTSELGGDGKLLRLPELLREEGELERQPAPDDLAVIAFTSGTTGDAKGVMLTHRNFNADVAACLERMPIGPEDVFLSIAPWYHSYGLTVGLFVPFWTGAATIYTDNYKELPRLMKETGMTILIGVPKLYHLMFDHVREAVEKRLLGRLAFRLAPKLVGRRVKRELASARLRFFVSGSAPLTPKVARDFRRLGIGIIEGYGLTEAGPVVAFSYPFDRKVGTVGPILPGMEVRILEPNDEGVGEVLVRGPNVMRGYYKNPARTAEALDQEGWLHTGDSGMLDKDGYIYIKGRRKNVIVLESGKNVYPEEIEWELSHIPYIAEVLVKRGYRGGKEVVQAHVYPNWERLGTKDPQVALDLIWEEVKRVSEELAHYKRLKSKEDLVLVEQPFAKTSTMDIKRYLYQEEGVKR